MALDGHSYECAAIRHWFREHRTSPVTNERLHSTLLVRNFALRNARAEWQDLQSAAAGAPPADPSAADERQSGVAVVELQHAGSWTVARGAHD
eukprot:SAG11_NODE_33476_length_277_cov_0.584270_1_plen_92_part_11